jgi:hypothetical protein
MNLDDEALVRAPAVCVICRIQVPLDEVLVPEVMDCLTWLCGFDCYARWRTDATIPYPMLSATQPFR